MTAEQASFPLEHSTDRNNFSTATNIFALYKKKSHKPLGTYLPSLRSDDGYLTPFIIFKSKNRMSLDV